MKRPGLVLTSTLLALAAAAPTGASATPAHRDHCTPRAHEEVRARSNAAVILLRRTRVLIGCSTATGRRVVIDTAYGYWTFFEKVHVRGTVVAYVITQASKYMDGTSQLYRADAMRARGRWLVDGDSWVSDVAIGPGGTIAYVGAGSPSYVLRVNRPNGAMLDVDGALHLRDVRFVGDRLTWRHGTTTQSADVTPIDRCGGHSGTLTLALTKHTASSSVTACLRATGASRTFVTKGYGSAATSGPWIAASPDDATIVTANLASNTGETIPAPGAGIVAINPNGTVAWTARSDSPASARSSSTTRQAPACSTPLTASCPSASTAPSCITGSSRRGSRAEGPSALPFRLRPTTNKCPRVAANDRGRDPKEKRLP